MCLRLCCIIAIHFLGLIGSIIFTGLSRYLKPQFTVQYIYRRLRSLLTQVHSIPCICYIYLFLRADLNNNIITSMCRIHRTAVWLPNVIPRAPNNTCLSIVNLTALLEGHMAQMNMFDMLMFEVLY